MEWLYSIRLNVSKREAKKKTPESNQKIWRLLSYRFGSFKISCYVWVR
jgi:hypothetical protein